MFKVLTRLKLLLTALLIAAGCAAFIGLQLPVLFEAVALTRTLSLRSLGNDVAVIVILLFISWWLTRFAPKLWKVYLDAGRLLYRLIKLAIIGPVPQLMELQPLIKCIRKLTQGTYLESVSIARQVLAIMHCLIAESRPREIKYRAIELTNLHRRIVSQQEKVDYQPNEIVQLADFDHYSLRQKMDMAQILVERGKYLIARDLERKLWLTKRDRQQHAVLNSFITSEEQVINMLQQDLQQLAEKITYLKQDFSFAAIANYNGPLFG